MTQPKKKLYLATVPSFTVMYLSEDACAERDAVKFAREETLINGHHLDIEIKEISAKQEVPEEWCEDALLWGTDDEITAIGFLEGWLDEEEKEEDPEWEEFMRLKKKFGETP
jgi:hypothetical protein